MQLHVTIGWLLAVFVALSVVYGLNYVEYFDEGVPITRTGNIEQ